MNKNKWIKIFLYGFASVVVANFSLKYFLTQVSIDSVKKDPALGWDFSGYRKKNFNDLGFRTLDDSSTIKSSGKRPIVFLGNSVVAGDSLSYKEAFPHLINKYLDSRYIALNAGSEGYEIFRENLKYQRDYSQVNPKIVVWFPSTNDYQKKSDVFNNFVQTAEAQGTQKKFFSFKLNKGFNLLAAKIQNFKEVMTEKFLWSQKNNQYTDPLLKSLPKDNLSTLVNEIQNMNNFMIKNNTKLIVVFIPPHYFCKYLRWEDAKSFIELKNELKKMEIPTISLFDKLPCRDKLLYEDYVHFNKEGHEELAKLLSIELKPYL